MNMSMNLRDYVKIYDDFLDQDTCKNLVDELNKEEWTEHTFYQAQDQKFVSFEKELSICYNNASQYTKVVQDKIWFAIQKYILKDFADFAPWFSGWNGYTQVRFNRYNVDTRMKLHCDHIHSMFDGNRKGIPTLSILGSLNDDYEGGDLVFWESEKITLKAGQIMLFPSNFMYPHRVDEVTSGTRYSYVSWAW